MFKKIFLTISILLFAGVLPAAAALGDSPLCGTGNLAGRQCMDPNRGRDCLAYTEYTDASNLEGACPSKQECCFPPDSEQETSTESSTTSGLVPNDRGQKENGSYTLDDFVQIGVNGMRFVLGIVGSLVLLMFIYGGFLFLISGASTNGKGETINRGKDVISAAVVGLVIVLASWLIISFLMSSLGYNSSGFGSWYSTEIPSQTNSELRSNNN